ncbi:hypothetical protein [Nocardioides sp. 616]|uniref:hypothetical protein n=1 Tax=Nocardioides sp. 616 TaxID=2268090 RepID=UPI000CE50218|nr:hypothetical protein [Nocardioides sp. 616]
MNLHPTVLLTAPGVAALLAVGMLTPAHAATASFVDGDDRPMKADILEVRVAHNADRIRVRISFDDLVRSGLERSQGVSIFFDTDEGDAGPEYRLGGGLNSGTDYLLAAVEGWNDDGAPVESCDYLGRINWRRDTVTYLVDPPCFGDVPAVRVAVKAGESRRRGVERNDWLLGRRVLTDPVARG